MIKFNESWYFLIYPPARRRKTQNLSQLNRFFKGFIFFSMYYLYEFGGGNLKKPSEIFIFFAFIQISRLGRRLLCRKNHILLWFFLVFNIYQFFNLKHFKIDSYSNSFRDRILMFENVLKSYGSFVRYTGRLIVSGSIRSIKMYGWS